MRAERNKTRRLFQNLIYAFSAQGISLILSVLMSLLVPKLLGITDFGYWQLFLFYVNYVGFTHFGLVDGVYLRLGGQHYRDLDFPLLGTQFWLLVAEQVLFGGIIAVGACLIESDPSRRFVWMMAALYMVVFNAVYYIGFILQATNHTRQFSISVMIDKAAFILCVVVLMFFRQGFGAYVLCYTLTKAFALLYCAAVGRRIVFAPLMKPGPVVREALRNIAVGINLLLANMAGMLILGSGRFVVDGRWGIEAFGKFSFALSLTNFFLTFIGQVSMVLFPALRQTDERNLKSLYTAMRDGLGIVLSAIFLLYLPVKYLLGLWLPQYQVSLEYMAILLPLCTFDGKMQMLCNTYMKVLRKERVLLVINVIAFVISLLLSLIGAYWINDIFAVVIFMVVAIAVRSVIAEVYLARMMGLSVIKELAEEIALAVIFVCVTRFAPPLVAFFLFLAVYGVYLLLNRRKAAGLYRLARGVLRRKPAV